jgi:hypothetical protein
MPSTHEAFNHCFNLQRTAQSRQNVRYLLAEGGWRQIARETNVMLTCDLAHPAYILLITDVLSKHALNSQSHFSFSVLDFQTTSTMADSTSSTRCCSSHVIVLLLLLVSILVLTIGFGNQPLTDAVSSKLKINLKSSHGNHATAAAITTATTWKNVLLEEQSLHQIQIPEITDIDVLLKPMWSCSGNLEARETNKLLFNHVFKTAGSTLRSLLQVYSHVCHAGLAIAVECSALSFDSVQPTNTTVIWRNGGTGRRAGRDCKLKSSYSREQTPLPATPTLTTAYLEDNHIDILGGHVPMGSGYGWSRATKQRNIQHLVFFRDGARKFVSGILYLKPDKSLEEVVQIIRQRVLAARKQGKYYENYSPYIITPEQQAFIQDNNISITTERRVNLSMRNLVENNVIIGIVERMSESFEIMRYVMDADDELETMFAHFGMDSSNSSNLTSAVASNISILSSSKVMKVLAQDSAFMEELQEYVKYEDIILSFAMDMHMRQYEYVRKQQAMSGSK